MSLTGLVFWLTYVIGVAGALIAPLAGVMLYIFAYHLNPGEQWWGESIRAMGLRTSLIIAIAIVIGLVLRRPSFEGKGSQFLWPMPMMFLFTLIALSSLSWGYGVSERGLMQAEKLIKVLAFLMILVRCVRRASHYHLVLLTWMVGVFYIGYEAWSDVGKMIGGRLAKGLGGSDFAESGDLSAHLVATLPLIGAMFFMSRSFVGRVFMLLVGALAVNTIVLTRSRSALLGVAATALMVALSLPRGYRMRGVGAIVLGTLLAVQLTDPGWWQRMQTISLEPQDGSAIGRLQYWTGALHIAGDHPLGIGLGNFQSVIQEYVPGLTIVRAAHNTYLECLAEMGLLGLGVLVLIVLGALYRTTVAARAARDFDSDVDISITGRRTRFHLAWHATALRAGLVGYLVCAFFQSRVVGEDFWILLTLAICLGNVATYMERSEAEPAPSAELEAPAAWAVAR